MRKGITPIISIIILLLITVALAGAAWTFLQGFIFPQITKSFLVPTGGSYCSNVGGANTIKVYALNTGYQSELYATPSTAGGDFIIVDLDGVDISENLTQAIIPTGETQLILEHTCVGGGCASGTYYTLDIGTSSTVQHLSIYCP